MEISVLPIAPNKGKEMKHAFTLIVPALLSGCYGAPDCSSSKTKDLAIKSITQQLEKSFNANEDELESVATSGGLKLDKNFGSIKFELDNTVLMEKNEETGKYTCQADLISKMGDSTGVVSVMYTSQLANDGKNHLVRINDLDDEKQGYLLGLVMFKK